MSIDLTKLGEIKDWVQAWSMKLSLQSDSHAGELYTKTGRVLGRTPFPRVIYVYHDGVTDCWISAADREALGVCVAEKIRNEETFATTISANLKGSADEVSAFLKAHAHDLLSPSLYENFWSLFCSYYLAHMHIKYVVDYLTAGELEKYLPILQDARLYAEPIFTDMDNFFNKVATEIGTKMGYTEHQMTATLQSELHAHLSSGQPLPEPATLEERFHSSVLIFDNGNYQLFLGEAVQKVNEIIRAVPAGDEIQGETAFKGKARGRVRIIFNPHGDEATNFAEGDILVTGMTRPEFLPLMKKSAAIVTDSGGILSHAAITSREMKKPCVIGTKAATKFFKDGDMVEVDAEKGVVRKI